MGKAVLCLIGLLLRGCCSDIRVGMAPMLRLRGGGEGAGTNVGAGSSRPSPTIEELMDHAFQLSNLVKNMSDSARTKFPDANWTTVAEQPSPQPSKSPGDSKYMTGTVLPLFAEAARDIAAAKPARAAAYLARWFMERANRDLETERKAMPARAISAGPPPHSPTDLEEGPGGNYFRTSAVEGDPLVHRPPGTGPLSVSFKELGFDPTTGENITDELAEGVVRAGEGGDSKPLQKGFLADPKGLGEGAPGPAAGAPVSKTTEQILAEAQKQRLDLEDWVR
jgi:hypothetical protein